MEDKQKFKLRHLIIPASLYKETKFTLISLKVYCFIHAYTNPFFFGNEHLAEMFDCSTQSISDSIKLLQDLKYIDTQYKSRPTGGKSRLVIDLLSDKSSSYSRVPENEAPTSHLLIDKESKDNILKENAISFEEKEDTEYSKNPHAVDFNKRHQREANKGKGLNQRPSFNNYAQDNQTITLQPLTKIEQWEIAKELRVPPYEVYDLHKEIMERVEDGSFNKKWGNSMRFVLKNWIRNAIKKGQVEVLDELGMQVLEGDHPVNVEKRLEKLKKLQEEGVL